MTKVCFMGYLQNLLGTSLNRHSKEEEDLTRARMSMHRVCVYHVGHVGRGQGLCGEIIAHMCWECVRFQVDVIAGDDNKAAYLPTPKAPGCPTYLVSLLQFWIDRMIHTATQWRLKNYELWSLSSNQGQTLHLLFL